LPLFLSHLRLSPKTTHTRTSACMPASVVGIVLIQPFQHMRKIVLLLSILTTLGALHAQSGCPGCAISLPDSLAADTIYISAAPDGEAGQYYEADLSFRLPMTTTPVAAVDSTVLPGLDIDQISIQAVVNLPPGLQWEASQLVFDTGNGQTDGCARLCGTPLQPGLYIVSVVVVAQVSIVTQSSGFTFPIYIAPATSQTEGFSMSPASACGQATVTFHNNIPSNGLDGITYAWDFGNGQTSTEENPAPQTYSQPGIYPVSYEATIDTTGFILSAVTVEQVGCADAAIPPLFNGAPDLFVRLYGPGGALVYESEVIDNAGVPVAFSPQVLLEPGVYTLEVRDDDLIGSEHCGEVLFTRDSNGLMINEPLHAAIQIVHPVQHITSADTVRIFPLPQNPVLTLSDPGWLCPGDTLALASQYGAGIQWYRDSTILATQTDSILPVWEAGAYWQQYTSPDGCQVRSDTLWVEQMPAPPLPLFYNDHNLLVLQNPAAFHAYALQWYQDGQAVGAPGDTSLCVTQFGTYTLVATDP
ncbi:MAG: PKD domain-containing protein, partial [Bacteroidetes bacterium]